MRPGSRTLEAPRGNRYAPARGMRLMMMMMYVTDWYMSLALSLGKIPKLFAFLPLAVAKLSVLKSSPVFLAHPLNMFYSYL